MCSTKRARPQKANSNEQTYTDGKEANMQMSRRRGALAGFTVTRSRPTTTLGISSSQRRDAAYLARRD